MKFLRRAFFAIFMMVITATVFRRSGNRWDATAARWMAAARTPGTLMSRIAVVGRGVVGDRIVRRLPTVVPRFELVAVDPRRVGDVPADASTWSVLAQGGAHAPAAAAVPGRRHGGRVGERRPRRMFVHCSTSTIWLARDGVPIVVGAGMSPGLTGLLARLLADQLASCDEIHVAIHGTAGPACARNQHDALRRLGGGLRRRDVDPTPGGFGSRADVLPRAGRPVRLLPSRAHRRRSCCTTPFRRRRA